VKARVFTALIVIPVVLAAIVSASPWPLFILAALLCGVAYDELGGLTARQRTGVPIVPALLFLGFGLYAVVAPGFVPILSLVALSIFGSLLAPLAVNSRSKLLLEVSSMWIVCPLLALCLLQALYYSPGSWWRPAAPVLVILLPLWAGDTLAYLVGRRFGRHLLAPKISPNKTKEGAMANLLGCLIVALLIGRWLGMPIWIAAACGIISGTFGQAGDLYESALKRAAGKKDTGTILPGHGGILDRIDSLLAAAPLEALLLAGFWPVHLSR
jgi:phosphatidate cytidylyltransferase